MQKLKITSPEGNTTEEHFTPAEMANWFSRAERAELALTGRLRQLVGLNGVRLIEAMPTTRRDHPAESSVDGLHHLLVSETNGMEYVVRYSAAEMDEVFTYEQRVDLDRGGALVIGTCRYVDMVAAARTVR